jgi:hypothetical glycosyl hydrolase
MRASLEEDYPNKRAGLFISATFNTVPGPEVPELPNGAEVTKTEITLDGNLFNQMDGEIKDYNRSLNMKEPELTKSLV